ncbi:MAG: hypothetical protein WC749_00760 [Dehalococcoidia bacterium]
MSTSRAVERRTIGNCLVTDVAESSFDAFVDLIVTGITLSDSLRRPHFPMHQHG